MPGAPRTIGHLSSQWVIHSGQRCRESDRPWRFSDRQAASSWLKQFRPDPHFMASLRAVLSEHGHAGARFWRSSDEEALQALSWLLSSGVLHAHRVPAPATRGRSAATASASPQAAASSPKPTASRTSSASPPPTPVAEADTFSAQTDAAATAAVLRSAAASGVPFCEECAKAASGRAA